jgi:hypothetical protein
VVLVNVIATISFQLLDLLEFAFSVLAKNFSQIHVSLGSCRGFVLQHAHDIAEAPCVGRLASVANAKANKCLASFDKIKWHAAIPFWQNFSDSFGVAPTGVKDLFSGCCPAAISWGVSEFVVYPVDGVRRGGAISHIEMEVFESPPTFTDSDASSAVPGEGARPWVGAALKHALPRAVDLRSRKTVPVTFHASA